LLPPGRAHRWRKHPDNCKFGYSPKHFRKPFCANKLAFILAYFYIGFALKLAHYSSSLLGISIVSLYDKKGCLYFTYYDIGFAFSNKPDLSNILYSCKAAAAAA